MSRRYFSSTAQRTTLSAGVGSGDTVITVGSVSGFPASKPYTLVIGEGTASEEIVEVTAGSGTSLVVTRGVDGTAATSHLAGVNVWHGLTARDLDEPNAHVNASSSVHGVTGSVVGTTDSQTLTNKSIDFTANTLTNVPISAIPTLDAALTAADASALAAAASESAAALSEAAAAGSESAAASSAGAALSSEVAAAASAAATAGAVAAHEADTTNVHGIADTSALVLTSDARLSDTRTPSDNSVTSAKIVDGTIVNADISASAAIAPSKIDGTAVVTADSRLSDARTPTAHASTHAAAGSDPVTVAESQVTGLTSALAAKAPLASPTFSGTVVLPSTTSIGSVDATEIGYLDGVTSAVQTQLNAKAPTASPTFTGVVAVPAGSASAPSIVPTGDTNTGIYSPGADQLAISTAGTARVEVDANGLVGINGTPTSRLTVSGSASTQPAVKFTQTNSGSYTVLKLVHSDSGAYSMLTLENSGGKTADVAILNNTSEAILFRVSNTERMRIDNAGLITGTGTSLGAWTAYTPSLTNATLGDGTITGYYCRIGKIVHFRAHFVLGSTSTIHATGNYISLPVTAASDEVTIRRTFATQYLDASVKSYTGVCLMDTTSRVYLQIIGTNGAESAVTTTAPFTWGTGDKISVFGTYEAA